jgi:glycosyltransferase involved in cell wall biosynthesis
MAPDLALSIILPVHNAQSTLAAQVARVLDTVAEVTPLFEVVIVDDGSTDQTSDIAHELAVEYPQLRVFRHAEKRGGAAAAATGVFQARGEITFVYEGRTPLKASDLPRLWDAKSRPAPPTADGEVIDAQLVEESRFSAASRSRIRALRDQGRASPPPAKITPRRRIRPRALS